MIMRSHDSNEMKLALFLNSTPRQVTSILESPPYREREREFDKLHRTHPDETLCASMSRDESHMLDGLANR